MSGLSGLYGIGEQQPNDASAGSGQGWAYHLPDALGSVRQLTNASGAVTLAKAYEPYGTVLSSVGMGASVYGYTSEQQQDGLVYLRARYYASSTGRFLTRDIWEGDSHRPMSYNPWLYVVANPIEFTDPTGLIPCSEGQTARLCILTKGGYLDIQHFRDQRGMAEWLMTQALPARYGKRFGTLELNGVLGDGIPAELRRFFVHSETYYTNLPAEGLSENLLGVTLAIIMDYSVGFETHQGIDPRCFVSTRDLGHCSSFSNEDLPSNYLGIISAGKNLSLEDIVRELGGGEQADQNDPPSEYWGNPCDPAKCALGFCGNDIPSNNRFTLKIYDPFAKHYNNQPWPSSLTVQPIGFRTYWGKSLSDFAVPVPTPPSTRPPEQTPTPRPQRTPEPPHR